MKNLILVIVILLGTYVMGQSSALQTWDPTHIVWQNTFPDGTKWSVLEGDQDAPGKAFTYAAYIPAGYWDHHSHNQDARVAVISGSLKLAIGPALDKEGSKDYPAGTFLLVPANVEHTMGATVDTIVVGTAIGPWKTHHDEDMHHH